MPFCDEKVIEKLEQRLAEVNSVTAFLDEGLTPEQILEKLLGDMDLVINDSHQPHIPPTQARPVF